MMNLRGIQRVAVVGGGTAGWFAALEMRHCFGPAVDVLLIESEQIGIIGAGEGSIPNFESALRRYGIDRADFMGATEATYKLGVCFEGWRGTTPDCYHHLFGTTRGPIGLQDWQEQGFYPLSSALMASGHALDAFPTARRLADQNASQAEVAAYFLDHPNDVFAYHFDARKLAGYLRLCAEARGVRRIDTIVRDAACDASGQIAHLHTDQGLVDADFFIDASGFRRILAQKCLGIGWKSFHEHLLLAAA